MWKVSHLKLGGGDYYNLLLFFFFFLVDAQFLQGNVSLNSIGIICLLYFSCIIVCVCVYVCRFFNFYLFLYVFCCWWGFLLVYF